MFIKTSLNTYSWGHINDTFGLDNDQFAIDELVLQSKKLEDDDSGNSTGKLSGLSLLTDISTIYWSLEQLGLLIKL